jgi:CheY-like chemotaxis protein
MEPLEDLMAVKTEKKEDAGGEDLAISEEALMGEITSEAGQVTEATPPAKQEEIVSGSGAKTIMVIDDSIVIRKMIEIALEDEDFRILSATSGKDGMEAVERENPDLIILDMLLPDMNGIDVLKKIKETRDLPVIMLSGKDSPQLVENAKEAGVNDFLPKPFKDEELVEKVKTLIG